MGVHLTFVRSVDLDEWTQPQIDAMRLGGNGNARAYFRKHGFTDLYGGKTDKKYNSKAAQSYKCELSKLVAAAAAKRGDVNAESKEDSSAENGGSLLKNLEDADRKNQEQELTMVDTNSNLLSNTSWRASAGRNRSQINRIVY